MSCGPGGSLKIVAVLLLCFVAVAEVSELSRLESRLLPLLSRFVHGSCPPGFFQCSNGFCIREAKHCDHRKDCPDGGDELNCDNIKCESPLHYKCEDGRCIQTMFMCDGNNDCGDWSDEKDCNASKTSTVQRICKDDEFPCGDNTCIPDTWVCDGLKDCRDGRDEVLGCSKKLDCGHDFLCSNHHCIPRAWECDGNDDCGDNSDELNCKRKDVTEGCTIQKGLFGCHDKLHCLELAEVCDGTQHCLDGSDEGPMCQKSKVQCQNQGCSYKCQATPQGPICLCPVGFNILNDKYCTDIDECQIYGICSQKCVNIHGGYNCTCDEGYTLQEDNHTCTVDEGEAILLFSTKKEVRVYFMKNDVYISPVRNLQHVAGVAYDGLSVYWTSVYQGEESIVRSNHDGSITEVLVSAGLGLPEDLALDLVTGNIYFTDGEESFIGVCTKSGLECTVLVNEDIQKPRGIALLTRNGTMFWSDWGDNPKIATAGMDGSSPKIFVTGVHWPNGITIDLGNERLYWVDAKLQSIESVTLAGTDRRVILEDVVKHPYSIAVFENTLYWSDWKDREIASCHKFTGKNHKVLVRSKQSHIYGIKVYHSVLHPKMKNPCEDAGCSDICMLAPNNTYTCACPVDKQLGVDMHTCKAVLKKELIVAVAGNHIIEVQHKLLGKPYSAVMVSRVIKHVNAVTYSSVDDLLILSDDVQKKLFSLSMSSNKVKPLLEKGIGKITSLAFDAYGNNVYWTDSERATVEAMSMNTKAVGVLLRSSGAEPPVSVVVVPDEGYMFVAFSAPGHMHLDKVFMDGSGTRVHVMEELVGPYVAFYYDTNLGRIFIADSDRKTIASLASDGMEHHDFMRLSQWPVSVAALGQDLFWTVHGANHLYWANKFFGDSRVKKLDLAVADIPEDIENIFITAARGVTILPNHPCYKSNGGCSHLCLMKGQNQVCGCPEGLSLLMDNFTCLEPLECKGDEFYCEHDKKCVPVSYRCNGVNNCPSGDDEKNCASCHEHEFACRNGHCISIDMKCDRVVQCPDGSDEMNCEVGICDPERDFQCVNGKCIDKVLRCDLMDDCGDGSDEEQCRKVTCGESEFRCRTGTCIPDSWECDGEINCPDASDEHDNCSSPTCGPADFTCANGHCVDKQLLCNDIDDCGDDSDESGCDNGGKANTTCSTEEFSCLSRPGKCIPLSRRCDGNADCPKAEDERDCACEPDQFECKNGKCISVAWLCDRLDDCGDKSDEDPGRCIGLHEEKELCLGFECPSGKCLEFQQLCDGSKDCEDGSDEGGKCSKACEDHPCGGECWATPAGPHCYCATGYQLAEDAKTCHDVNECEQHVCSQHCDNLPGTYACACVAGFVIRQDRTSCKATGPAMEYIFVTSGGQIRKVSQTLSHVDVVHTHTFLKITGLDVDARENSVCWSTRETGTIYCQSMNTHNRTYVEEVGSPTEIAIDWITKNIYYVNNIPDDQSYIQVCHMAEKLCAIVVAGEHGDKISNIVVDPLAGLLFWTECGLSDEAQTCSIHRADLAGGMPAQLVSGVGYVSGLAVDSIGRLLFWADATSHAVESITYDGDKRTEMFTTEVRRPKRLVLFEDDLYWLVEHAGVIMKCRLFGKGNRCDNVHVNAYDANFLTILQQSRQRDGHNPCEYHRCSHLCAIAPRGPKCLCPDGQVVGMGIGCKNEGVKMPEPRFMLPGAVGGSVNVRAGTAGKEESYGLTITMVIFSLLMVVLVVGLVCYIFKPQMKSLRKNLNVRVHFQKPRSSTKRRGTTGKASIKTDEKVYASPLQLSLRQSQTPTDVGVKESSFSGTLKKIRLPSEPLEFSDSESEADFPIGGKGDKERLIP